MNICQDCFRKQSCKFLETIHFQGKIGIPQMRSKFEEQLFSSMEENRGGCLIRWRSRRLCWRWSRSLVLPELQIDDGPSSSRSHPLSSTASSKLQAVCNEGPPPPPPFFRPRVQWRLMAEDTSWDIGHLDGIVALAQDEGSEGSDHFLSSDGVDSGLD